MRKPFLILCFMLPLINSHSQNDGWQTLFNGTDFTGWKKLNGTAEFKIEEGVIVGIARLNTPNTFLCTEQIYGDFILELEVKIDSALNSGIQVRSNSFKDYQNGVVHGYQIEIDPSTRAYSGGIYDEARRGWMYPMTENKKGREAFKQNEWNHFRIEAVGNTIRVWVNGVNTANLVDDFTAEGFIGLQVHSIDNYELIGATVKWKNLRIKTENLENERWPMQNNAVELNLISGK